MWILRTVQGHEPALTFRLMPGTIKTLGRAVRADFIVDAAMVSRLHCRLTARLLWASLTPNAPLPDLSAMRPDVLK